MRIQNIIVALQKTTVYELNPEDLDYLLRETEILIERDTLISGFIRILKYENFFLTQETTDKNKVVLRLFKTRQDAESMINDHLDTYEQMWNGCGCKVDYYS